MTGDGSSELRAAYCKAYEDDSDQTTPTGTGRPEPAGRPGDGNVEPSAASGARAVQSPGGGAFLVAGVRITVDEAASELVARAEARAEAAEARAEAAEAKVERVMRDVNQWAGRSKSGYYDEAQYDAWSLVSNVLAGDQS